MGFCPLNNYNAGAFLLRSVTPRSGEGGVIRLHTSLNKIYPFTCDGFCRMHMFEDRILEDFEHVEILHKAGINEFIF